MDHVWVPAAVLVPARYEPRRHDDRVGRPPGVPADRLAHHAMKTGSREELPRVEKARNTGAPRSGQGPGHARRRDDYEVGAHLACDLLDP